MGRATFGALLLLLPHLQSANGQFTDLLQRIPGGANSLIVIHVDNVLDSPLAVQEKWREEGAKRFSEQAFLVPPTAAQFVMAAKLDLETLSPVWEMGVVKLHDSVDMIRLVRERDGIGDRFGKYEAVILPRNAVAVKFDDTTVGLAAPADRQQIAGWIRDSDSRGSPALSPYLAEAAGYAENTGTQIILAMDLGDILSAEQVRSRLEQSDALKGKSVDLDRMSRLLASIRGVRFGVNVTDRAVGALKVDFREDASPLTGLAKPVLLAALAGNGAAIDELQNWTEQVEGKTVSLLGYLEESGLRRLGALLNPPRDLEQNPQAQPQTQQQQEQEAGPQSMAYATRDYFHAVQAALKDLRGRKDFARISHVATWLDRYARKIDEMPLLNVDSDMVAFGGAVIDSLRRSSDAIRGIGMRTASRQSTMPSSTYRAGGYSRGGSGYYGSAYGAAALHQSNPDRRAVAQQEKVSGVAQARSIMREVDAAASQIRREMTQKYQIEF